MKLSCEGWCPQCYSNRRGRSNYRGHWGYRPPRPLRRANVGQFLKQTERALPEVAGPSRMTDEKFRAHYPALSEWLEEDLWPDGTPRETMTVLFFCDRGRFKAMVRDRDGKRVAFTTADEFDELLEALEAGLIDG